jgi:hypothetical protein
MGVSIRAYARHRGISHVSVMKAIEAGRIAAESDGSIDPARADRDWLANTTQPKHTANTVAAKVSVRAPISDAGAAPSDPSKGMTLLNARTASEIVKAQTGKLRLSKMKGDLIDRAQAIAHVFKLARAERDAWLNWPSRISSSMAATLKVDPHAMHVALEAAVREHLQELGEFKAQVD